MSRRRRLTLAILGLMIVAVSLLILAYVFWPLASVREQIPIAPTLFAPPQSLATWLRPA